MMYETQYFSYMSCKPVTTSPLQDDITILKLKQKKDVLYSHEH